MERMTNDRGEVIIRLEAKVIAISDNVRELNNDKQTKFRNVTVQVKTPDGELKTRNAKAWESNIKNINVGATHLVDLQQGTNQAGETVTYATVTPFVPNAWGEDFGSLFESKSEGVENLTA